MIMNINTKTHFNRLLFEIVSFNDDKYFYNFHFKI